MKILIRIMVNHVLSIEVEQLKLGRKTPSAKVKLRRNGTSIVTTIPKKFLEFLNWDLGTELEVTLNLDVKNPRGDFLIIRPVEKEDE